MRVANEMSEKSTMNKKEYINWANPWCNQLELQCKAPKLRAAYADLGR